MKNLRLILTACMIFSHVDLFALQLRGTELLTDITPPVSLDTFIELEELLQTVEPKDEGLKPVVITTDINNWLDDNVAISTIRPSSLKGKLKIGIRWPCHYKDISVDLDLYTRSTVEYHYLFFGIKKTPEGVYYKDYLRSPDAENALEYVDFTKEIDITKLEVMINFYAGVCPGGPKGQVRAWFEGQVYELPFHITAKTGNRAGIDGGLMNNNRWLIIDVNKLFKL